MNNRKQLPQVGTNQKGRIFVEELEGRINPSFMISQLTQFNDYIYQYDSSISVAGEDAVVAFSSSSNLTGENADNNQEIFVYEHATGSNTQITRTEYQTGPNFFYLHNTTPSVSGDGSAVVFVSNADLTGDNTEHHNEVFLFDRLTEQTIQVTDVSFGNSYTPLINHDGSVIVFMCTADPLGTNPDHNTEVFRYDHETGTVTQVTDTTTNAGIRPVYNSSPGLSGNGSAIAFISDGDLTGENPDHRRHVFHYDHLTGKTTQLTDTSFGTSYAPRLNYDGTVVVFTTNGDLTGENPDHNMEIFRYDRGSETVLQITQTEEGTNVQPATSGDGSVTAFVSSADLTGDNPNGEFHLFRHDTITGAVTQVDDIPLAYVWADARPFLSLNDTGSDIGFFSYADPTGDNPDNRYQAFLAQYEGGMYSVTAGPGGENSVGVFGADNQHSVVLNPFTTVSEIPSDYAGGVRSSTADLTGDGQAEVATGTGPGAPAFVEVYDQSTSEMIWTVNPFENTYMGGVNLTAGDLNNDDVHEVIVTADVGGGPRVRVLDGKSGATLADFFGIEDINFRGGARAGVGDINGDGVGDLIIAAGHGGGPRVAVFDGARLFEPVAPGELPVKLIDDFFAFNEDLRNGLYVAGGDVTGDNIGEVIIGSGEGGGPRVLILDGAELMAGNTLSEVSTHPVANFFADAPDLRGGIRVASKDIDDDAKADLITGVGPGGAPAVTRWLAVEMLTNSTPEPMDSFFALDEFFMGGVFVG